MIFVLFYDLSVRPKQAYLFDGLLFGHVNIRIEIHEISPSLLDVNSDGPKVYLLLD